MDTNAVVFWDEEGVELVTITAVGIDSSVLLDILDTPENRQAFEKATGRLISNTSEEILEAPF